MWGGGRRQEREFFVFAGNANVVFGQNFNKKSHKIVGNCLHGRVKKRHQYASYWNAFLFITTRKRSLRRLCFHRCLSVHWAGTPQAGTPPGRYTPRGGTPPGQVHPPGRYTSQQVHPPHPRQVQPPMAGTHPREGTPPAPVHAGIQSTSRRYVSHWNAFLFIN